MTPLIDATEMYLRTVWELEEEGITPIRARLVERLHLSAPAVSETVARLEDDGLMAMNADRTLGLTDKGRRYAASVMRKHRLAEVLLIDVIGLAWEHVHVEACRWEHVISDMVEDHIATLLGSPSHDPHGNPIPGVDEPHPTPHGLLTLGEAAKEGLDVRLARISELLQSDVEMMHAFRTQGLLPNATMGLSTHAGEVVAMVNGHAVTVPSEALDFVYVEPIGA